MKYPKPRSAQDILREALSIQDKFRQADPVVLAAIAAHPTDATAIVKAVMAKTGLAFDKVGEHIGLTVSSIKVAMDKLGLEISGAVHFVANNRFMNAVDAVRLAQPYVSSGPLTGWIGSSTGRLNAIKRINASPDGSLYSALIGHCGDKRDPLMPAVKFQQAA